MTACAGCRAGYAQCAACREATQRGLQLLHANAPEVERWQAAIALPEGPERDAAIAAATPDFFDDAPPAPKLRLVPKP